MGGGRGAWPSSNLAVTFNFYHQVLQTGAELTELDSSGFATQAPTVFAGNLGEGEYIVQVGMGGGGVHGTGRYWGAGEYIIVTCQCLSFCVCVQVTCTDIRLLRGGKLCALCLCVSRFDC